MSITTTVTVFIGDSLSLPEFTDRCLGAQIVQDAPVAVFGTGTARITLDNNDGALTPGSVGTYSNVDWFTQAMFIKATVNGTTVDVFHGIVSEFQLRDDGVNSYVDIAAIDGMSTGGAGTLEIDIPTSRNASLGTHISRAYDGGPDVDGYIMPLLAGATSNVVADMVGVSNFTVTIGNYTFSGRTKDWVNSVAMPCGPSTAWPTTIGLNLGTGDDNYYFFNFMNAHLVRDSSERNDFVFAEAASDGELPFRNLIREYNNDDVINTVTIDFVGGNITSATTVTKSNTVSINKYGARQGLFGEVIQGDQSGDEPISANSIAERWANTFADSAFVVSRLELSSLMCDDKVGSSSASADMWRRLLSVESGLCQLATVEFTPTGATTPVVELAMINSRTIQVTPEDVRIILGFLPGDQAAVLVLDDSMLGILGGTVQEYDDTGDPDTYDSVVAYDGETVAGFRLG